MTTHSSRPLGLLLSAVALCMAVAATAARADRPFEARELPSPGRTVMAEIVDLDGDARSDLLEVAFVDVPPREKRRIRVRFQKPNGTLPSEPDLEVILPSGAAAYDLADVLDVGGHELLLLEAEGLVILAFVDGVQTRRVNVPGAITIGAAQDERGLDRMPLVTRALAPEPWLVIPGLNESFLLSVTGELRARLSVGGRSNYFIQPPGPTMTESDIQIFFDAPRLQFGDVDGDGRTDVVAAGRHQLRVFLRRADGSLPIEPDHKPWLARVSPEDHVRGSGAVRSLVRDIDADGRADLVIAEVSGGILDSKTKTSIYLNRSGGWSLDTPDAVFESERAVSAVQLLDLDGDTRMELLRIRVPVTILEIVEVLVTQALDARVAAYGMDKQGRFSQKPRFERKFGIPLNFETSRIRGFMPTFDHDLNGDGLPDLITSGDGTRIEVYLGRLKKPYAKRDATQPLAAEGMIRAGDIDGDGLADLVLFNPRRPDLPILLLRNHGVLEGTPPMLRAASK